VNAVRTTKGVSGYAACACTAAFAPDAETYRYRCLFASSVDDLDRIFCTGPVHTRALPPVDLRLSVQLTRQPERLGFGGLEVANVARSFDAEVATDRVGEIAEHRLKDSQLVRSEGGGVERVVVSCKPVGVHAPPYKIFQRHSDFQVATMDVYLPERSVSAFG